MMNANLGAECWGNQTASVFGGQGKGQGTVLSLAPALVAVAAGEIQQEMRARKSAGHSPGAVR